MRSRPSQALLSVALIAASMAPALAQTRSNSSDSTWTPRQYTLPTVSGTTSTVAPLQQAQQCAPTVTKLSQGACENNARVVTYSDGCGTTSRDSEACDSSRWTYFYRGIGGGDGWINTSSAVKLACVAPGTSNRVPDSECGPLPASPSPCRIGASSVSTVQECPAGTTYQFPTVPEFWGPGAIASCIAGC
jgi:hypothetical protein